MKKIIRIIVLALIIIVSLTSCDLISELVGKDDDNIHTKEYEPLTGKYVLYDNLDKRYEYTDTYFMIDGSKGNFSLKYYENSKLKSEGKINRVVTRRESIGYLCDTLHINVSIDNHNVHMCSYCEDLDNINQFRIIDEYHDSDYRYYLSEIPFVLGTYVREGKEYKKEGENKNKEDYTIATISNFTVELNGKFKLDDNHYFYFINTKGYTTANGFYIESYFQYYSNELEKPLEGFVSGRKFDSDESGRLYLTYSNIEDRNHRKSTDSIIFGYYTFDDKDNMYDHFGSVDFSDGVLKSFEFEYLSREWTDQEWDLFTKDKNYHMPDSKIYEYKGGTYYKEA